MKFKPGKLTEKISNTCMYSERSSIKVHEELAFGAVEEKQNEETQKHMEPNVVIAGVMRGGFSINHYCIYFQKFAHAI